MRIILTGLLGLFTLSLPLAAQQQQAAPVAGWLADFSNLPKETRAEYIDLFHRAKRAYVFGDWIICYALLEECEMLYNKNPHVWNLRTVCLIAQDKLEEAEQELIKAKKELPHDETTYMNIANLHMAKGEYQQCIDVLRNIIDSMPDPVSQNLVDILTFRIYLCHIMLGQRKEARKLVSHLTPLSDTPLYYYSQAALHISRGNKTQARQDIQAADTIFAKGNATLPYLRAIQASGLEEKFLKNTP